MLSPETILQGRYRVVRQLGQGGMGAVYEAIDQRLDTTVALKETLFTDERLRKQFEREARLLARLHHPALPRVSDHFSEGDGQFLVMQFIPGDDLSEMMNRKRGPFPPDQVLTWADQLLDALDYLHTQDPQIVHRDIKPQNLKLTSRGQIILLDFGLAKGQAGDISRVTTNASIFGYTPNYAPLEQIQGLGTDSRSDLYSLGATLYHLMTGVKPPDALTRAAALVNGQPDPLTPASEANPAVAPDVDAVLAKSMAQNREQRYATAADMRKALHETDQATTVVNRGEAQTVLFPPPARTAAPVPTQTVVGQNTVKTGETTVVRPVNAGQGRRMLPIALSAVALVVLACGVFGFYMWQKRDDRGAVQVTNITTATPSPAASPASVEPTPEPSETKDTDQDEEETATTAPKPTPKKQERASRNDEPRSDLRPDEPRVRVEVQTHDDDEDPPDVPVPPNSAQGGPNRPRRPQTRVLPGGVVMRVLPDGSQIIQMRDGTRVYVAPDGKRTVVPPRDRPNRRTPAPTPTPSP
ncbi:MAG TPA: protein kinase [Pyrinomonadaceae bacterium]|nr:protein kinase [Pyrinomonadaceae bacterium]